MPNQSYREAFKSFITNELYCWVAEDDVEDRFKHTMDHITGMISTQEAIEESFYFGYMAGYKRAAQVIKEAKEWKS